MIRYSLINDKKGTKLLDLKYTREHLEEVKERIGRRGQEIDWEGFMRVDGERLKILRESESLRAQRNQVSDLIAEKKKRKEDCRYYRRGIYDCLWTTLAK